jgi:RNA polymerase sigma factor (sigma-70 family)
MHDHLTILVTRAKHGDRPAWDELVERYAPLIWSICHRYRLSRAEAQDVGQSVWTELAGWLASLEDPAALPGWLATATQRECGRILHATQNREVPGHSPGIPDLTMTAESELLRAERQAALREAFTRLPAGSRQLIAMLLEDPPVPYSEISATLGIPVENIEPNRDRCLAKLRRDPAVAALISAGAPARSPGQDAVAPAQYR